MRVYPVPSTVSIKTAEEQAFDGVVLGLVNHGVWVQTNEVLPFRTAVTLTFEPDSKYSLSAGAEVVSVVDGGMGFELAKDASARVTSILSAWAEGRTARVEGETVPPPPPAPETKPRTGVSGKLVLVVEDEPAVARLLQIALQRRGAAVVVIGNGNDAISFIESHAVSVVLLDWMIPGAAGDVVLKRLRELEDPPPVAVVSGVMNIGASRNQAMNLGAQAIFSKPFRVSRICDWVDEYAR
jgi:CheY-like chemotaxis protein